MNIIITVAIVIVSACTLGFGLYGEVFFTLKLNF